MIDPEIKDKLNKFALELNEHIDSLARDGAWLDWVPEECIKELDKLNLSARYLEIIIKNLK